jgi:transposase-like protein
MPWKETTRMSLRMEFVKQALKRGRNINELCRRYGISRKTGYKWLRRYQAVGAEGLQDRSRWPQRSPNRTPAAVGAAGAQSARCTPSLGRSQDPAAPGDAAGGCKL